jgi:2-keto-4-pentenoate hydratase/2-oxohepta-3-ene-1,7-dioic acid hydratase in catechol pathway
MSDPTWALVQWVNDESRDPVAGVLSDGIVHELPGALAGLDMMALLRSWEEVEPVLRSLGTSPAGQLRVVKNAVLSAPLTYPRKVLGAGANYYDHAAEMGTDRPAPGVRTFFFFKPPSTTIVGPYDAVALPGNNDPRLDWEVELGIVIGRGGRHITPAVAAEHVAGFTVVNDLSARGDFVNDEAVAPVFAFDWLAHKGQDGFCPCGPGIVPEWLVPHPDRLPIRLSVNGALMQDSTTAGLITGIPELVSAASRWVTLEAGDLILSGTPAGVGAARQQWLEAGDVVVAEIDGVGRLENRIVSPARTRPAMSPSR